MKRARKHTIIFYGLGSPILLVNVSYKKVLGYWCLDIKYNRLMKRYFSDLSNKKTPLTDRENHFIEDYLALELKD